MTFWDFADRHVYATVFMLTVIAVVSIPGALIIEAGIVDAINAWRKR